MTFSQQSLAVQRLLNGMRAVGWGEIENLEIRDGEPVLEPLKYIDRVRALDKSYVPKPYQQHETLKPQVVLLLTDFREMQDGTIPVILIQDGLPFRVRDKVAI